MFRNKKGALELSITAIVVLIIAITVLGFAIFFIKSLFGGAQDIFGGKLAEIKKQMIDDMKDSGDLMNYNLASTEIKRGKPQALAIAIRNTGSGESGKVCFRTAVYCLQAFGAGECAPGKSSDVLVGGKDDQSNEPVPGEGWFEKLLGQTDIKNNEAEVIPANLLVRGAKPDTYKIDMRVYKAKDDRDCASAGEYELYDSKGLFIDVKA